MSNTISDYNRFFFIGIAGVGMSAIAQYLAGTGKEVRGSDRFFVPGSQNETRSKLEAEGIRCFLQDGSGLDETIDLVVVSTAIEDTVPEVQKARALNIPVLRRSEVLAMIARSRKSIAVGGTSGKSTTSAMLFQILETAGMQPSIMSGAGLVSIIKAGKIGNAKVGQGEWLIIEADESDGSIVQYEPEIGLLLNVDKDHQEIDELMRIFTIFKNNSREKFIANQSNSFSRQLSSGSENDFSVNGEPAAYQAENFLQDGMDISFTVNGHPFSMHILGRHNMENAVAAIAVAHGLGVEYSVAERALQGYEGIYRRHQLLGSKNGIHVIDDYAHNPAKCAASIKACQPIAAKVIAWFQPHGYGPTRFLRSEFVKEIAAALRPQDEIWMSEIFYAGGTAVKDISAADLINDLKAMGCQAYFTEDRNELLQHLRPHLTDHCVLLLMGARDPGLEAFSRELFQQL